MVAGKSTEKDATEALNHMNEYNKAKREGRDYQIPGKQREAEKPPPPRLTYSIAQDATQKPLSQTPPVTTRTSLKLPQQEYQTPPTQTPPTTGFKGEAEKMPDENAPLPNQILGQHSPPKETVTKATTADISHPSMEDTALARGIQKLDEMVQMQREGLGRPIGERAKPAMEKLADALKKMERDQSRGR
jgi:hypothetical protein